MHDDHPPASTGRPTPSASVPPQQPPGRTRRLISLRDAAAILGLSVPSVRRLIGSGRLHAVKLTRRVHVDLRDVDRLIEEAKDRRGW